MGAKATQLLEEIAAAEKAVVICFDEFPVLVNRLLKDRDGEITDEGRAAAEALLSWLRAASMRHRGGIRFVLCGSIGLEPVLRQGGLSGGVTTFTAFHLDPWDKPTAMGCLDALAANYDLTYEDGAQARLLDLIGVAIPHYVQVFFDLVLDDARRRSTRE